MITHPHTKPVSAWQYQAQHQSDWPAWVQRCCVDCGTELRLDRRSGRQVMFLGEWLVLEGDSRDPLWLTNAEYRRTYQHSAAERSTPGDM